MSVPSADSKSKSQERGQGSHSNQKFKSRRLQAKGLAVQLVEERFGILQVGGIKAFGEPAVDLCEHCTCLRAAEGIALIRQGMAIEIELGALVSIPADTASLATAQMLDGAIVDALETVEKSLQANPDALVHRPGALLLRGELRLKQGQAELAEVDFREAIALAQQMGAKAWELRAALSLARLLAKRGLRDEACTMLAELYDWFTEGFDTADLKDAKALLDQLDA